MRSELSLRTGMSADQIAQRGAEVISIEARALDILAQSVGESFVQACNTLIACSGRVVITGMGKSGHIGRKWAATMAATGTPALYVHPAEAAHGDLGMLISGDVLVVLSNSGNTSELQAFLRYAPAIGVTVVGVASRLDSPLLRSADVKICLPALPEACPANVAPTTSTTMQLALGDAIAMTLRDMRGISRDALQALHPGGSLGLRFTRVYEIMHGPPGLPLVDGSAPLKEVILTMTSKGFGIAGVVDVAGRLIGVITDGDLRRHFEELTTAVAEDVMTVGPKTVATVMLAEEALRYLTDNQITCAFVQNPGSSVNMGAPVGIIHVHDFIRLGLT